MKKWIKGIVFASLFASTVTITSCGKQNNPTNTTTKTTEINYETHSISFVTNCDITYNKVQGQVGTKVILPLPSKDGYTFTGWYLDEDLTNKFTDGKIQSTDITLYAKFEKNVYEITFVTKSKNTIDPIKAYEGDEITLPTPENVGYTFLGWYTASDEKYEETTMPKGGITLYAKWKLSSCVVTLEDTLHAIQDYALCEIGKSVEIETLSDMDYIFDGWYYDSSYRKKYSSTDVFNKDTTLYSKWVAKDYTISFVDYDEVEIGHVGQKIKLPVLTKTGYTFKGWSLTKERDNPMEYYIIPSGGHDEELYPVFEVNEYTLRYNSNGGSTVEPVIYAYGETIVVPSTPIRGGYTFKGWSPELPKTMPAYDLEVTAEWEANPYKITYELNGGVNEEDAVTSYKTASSQDIALPENPTKEAYIFGGWYTEDTFKNKVTTIVKGDYGDKTFYAKWIPISYDLSFEMNSGSFFDGYVVPNKITVEDEIELQTPYRFGYRFIGWYLDSSFLGDPIEKIEVGTKENISLYAKWEIINYYIEYEKFGGSTSETLIDTYNVEDDYTLPILSKTGYTFLGWYANVTIQEEDEETIYIYNESFKISNLKNHTENLKLYARFELTKYKITYVLNGGAMPKDYAQYYTFDENEIVLTNAYLAGAKFKGWYLEDTFETQITEIEGSRMEDITLYAKWEYNIYDITYELDGGVNPEDAPITYTTKDKITLPTPTKEGYTFNGWYTDSSFNLGKTEILPGETEDITLYAKWGAIEYAIRYYINGGNFSLEDSITYSYTGDETVIFAIPERTDYTFLGWYTEGTFKNKVESTEGFVEDISLFAKWTPTIYTITYELDGGENDGDNKISFTKDDIVDLYSPSKKFNEFLGWYTDSEFTESVDEINGKCRKNVTLYAKWAYLYTYTKIDNYIEITGLNPNCRIQYSELEIPNTIDGDWVESIGENAFKDNTTLEKIMLSNFLHEVKENAFSGCSSLATVSGIENVHKYGTYCFSGTAIGKIEISSLCTEIGYGSFANCSNLIISNDASCFTNLTKLGAYAFMNCTSINLISIPENVKVGEGVFAGCTSLHQITTSFIGNEMNGSITNLGYWFGTTSMKGCQAVEQLVDEENKTYYIPTSLTIIMYDGTSIPANTFMNCSNLQSISLSKVTFIGSHAFENCTGLTSLYLPNLETIGEYAFSSMEKITEFTIPKVKSIGSYAFDGCIGVETFDFSSAEYIGEAVLHYCYNRNLILPFLGSDASTPKLFGYLYDTTDYPDTIDSFTMYLFNQSEPNRNLANITINGGVLSEYAFAYCSFGREDYEFDGDLKGSITIKNVTDIPEGCFYSAKVASISLPNAESIGNEAFASARIGEGGIKISKAQCIGKNAFMELEIKTLSLPNSITSIGLGILKGSKVESLTVPFIGPNPSNGQPLCYFFFNQANIECDKNENIPSTLKEVTYIGSNLPECTFMYCSNITTLSIPYVKSIEKWALADMTSLKSIDFPESLLTVGDEILKNCTSLESITLYFIGKSKNPSSDAWIYPFGTLFKSTELHGVMQRRTKKDETDVVVYYEIPSSLKTVMFKGDVINSYAFENCTFETLIVNKVGCEINTDACKGMISLTTARFLERTTIYDYAFYECSNLSNIELSSGTHFLLSNCFAGMASNGKITYGGSFEDWNINGYGTFFADVKPYTLVCCENGSYTARIIE